MAELIIVLALVWVGMCIIIGDWIYSRGYAQGWDDSVIHEYEKEFD